MSKLFVSFSFRPLPFVLVALALSIPTEAEALVSPPAHRAGAKTMKPAKRKLKPVPATPAQPLFRNWGIYNSEAASHIDAQRAWKITEGSQKVVVAVIDTGIDASHPNLKGNLWRKAGTDEYGYDFVFNKKNPADVNGHGSHIAGIIAATLDRRKGVAGVAPQVTIMPLRYYADESVTTDTVANTARAVDYAIENGARIINYSSEGKGFNVVEYRALERAAKKGVLVVVAAGNSGENNDTADSPTYPASYDLPNLITVAATNIHNQLLPVSNYGPTRVHVAAPGENIFSTLPRGRYGLNTGTSQATAFVSGVAALLLSENPSLTASELKKIIMSSVDKTPSLTHKVASGGRLNAYKAVLMAQERKSDGLERAVATSAFFR